MKNFVGIIAAVACLALVDARPGPQASGVKPSDCRESALIQCVSPVIGFIFSSEGQQLSKIRKTSGLTETSYNKVCSLAQSTQSCIDSWVQKCIPPTPADLRILSNGTGLVIADCSQPEGFAKLKKILSCAEKMNDTHKSCGESMKAAFPKTNINYKDPKAVLRRPNMQRDLCCTLNKYTGCVSPAMATTCGEEERTLTEKLFNKMLGSYQCTQTVLDACPTAIATPAPTE